MKNSTKRTNRRLGRILAIGGAEDDDVLQYFVKLCGGRRARIVVCGAPSNKPREKERKYEEVFRKLGAASVFQAEIIERHDAERDELVEATRRATGVFYTGGDQLRLTTLVAGTRFGDLVQQRLFREGLVVGGTSAGAAAISSTMLIGGPSDGTVRRADVSLAPGFSYMRDTTIDTHFAQRGRVNRLFAVFAENPQLTAIGIDENTAIDVTPGRSFRVVGSGAVFVFDGKVTHSNAAEVGDDDVLAVTDVFVHVLPRHYSFDLRKWRPHLPNGKAVKPRKLQND